MDINFDDFNSGIYNLKWNNVDFLGREVIDSTRFLKCFDKSDVVSIKIDTKNVKTINLIESLGFRFVCVNLSFKLDVDKTYPDCGYISNAQEDDLPQLKKMAKRIFIYDRFHSAYYLPKNKSDELHSRWIENDFDSKQIIVYRKKGIAVGFLSYMSEKIYLLGVDKNFQRQGIGYSMVTSFINILVGQKKKVCYVDTQITNPVISLYQKLGFRLIGHIAVYYWNKSPCNIVEK